MRIRRATPCIWTALLLAAFTVRPAILPADEPFWPQFHGPKRDNLSTATGLLKRWPAGGPRLVWTARGLGHGFGSVSIANKMIYASGNIGGKTIVTALDLDGRIRWQAENGGAWEGDKPGARGTPTIDGQRLYHESPLGEVICLEARTGRPLWRLNILEKFHSRMITWAQAESVLIDGDRLICCPGGPETAMVALDKFTGQTVWKSASAKGDLAGYASPSLGQYRGLRMIFTLTSRAAIGVNADTGELLWRFEHETPFEEMITMPIYHDGHVLVTTRTTGSVLLKLNVEGKKVTVEPVWRSKDLDNQHHGVILLDGYLYGTSHVNRGGRWICLDWRTGQTRYVERGVGKGSLTYADGMFYILTEDGIMGLVRASPAGHEVISRFRIPPGGNGPTWAHPVVCDGRLYIRHSDLLYAYDLRSGMR
ncbi:MAG: outer membrane protein assembly factor BamB family protein [Thermoguttaceae bacterium]